MPSIQNQGRETLLGFFHYRRLNPAIEELIGNGLGLINQVTHGNYYVPSPTIFGKKIEVAERDGRTSVFASDHGRPTNFEILIFLEDGRVLLPSIRNEDFSLLLRQLNLNNIKDIVTLNGLIKKNYGIYEKNCPPRQIVTYQDLANCGIEDDIDIYQYLANGTNTLWWQMWGGFLYCFQYDPENRVAKVQNLRSFVGHLQHLPTNRLR